jgi:hypothetical protein
LPKTEILLQRGPPILRIDRKPEGDRTMAVTMSTPRYVANPNHESGTMDPAFPPHPSRRRPLACRWQHDARGRLVCNWHQIDPVLPR